jgi:hypothetical protein
MQVKMSGLVVPGAKSQARSKKPPKVKKRPGLTSAEAARRPMGM